MIFGMSTPLRYIFLIFCTIAISAGLIQLGMEHITAIFITAGLVSIFQFLKVFLFLYSIETSKESYFIFFILFDCLLIIPAIWGACTGWEWNIFIAIIVFLLCSHIAP